MAYTGGIRTRLIADSVYHVVKDNLVALGWMNAGREHAPITLRTEAVPNDEDIAFNTIVISESHTLDEDAELGSNLGEVTTTFWVDFYAENEALGKQLIHDVRDILRGRIPSIGRVSQIIPVYDWSMATPALIFSCDIEDVVVDQARDFPKAWQQHWWACRFDVVDYYSGVDE